LFIITATGRTRVCSSSQGSPVSGSKNSGSGSGTGSVGAEDDGCGLWLTLDAGGVEELGAGAAEELCAPDEQEHSSSAAEITAIKPYARLFELIIPYPACLFLKYQ